VRERGGGVIIIFSPLSPPNNWVPIIYLDSCPKHMGRITKGSMRTRLQDKMALLKRKYRMALKEDNFQTAFDDLWKSWAEEQAALIYSEILSPLDLLNLQANVDNRSEIMRLRERLAEVEALIKK